MTSCFQHYNQRNCSDPQMTNYQVAEADQTYKAVFQEDIGFEIICYIKLCCLFINSPLVQAPNCVACTKKFQMKFSQILRYLLLACFFT